MTFRAFLLLLFELNHVIPDAECTEAADKAGNAAETILLHVKGRVCLFQLIVYDAQIIHTRSFPPRSMAWRIRFISPFSIKSLFPRCRWALVNVISFFT